MDDFCSNSLEWVHSVTEKFPALIKNRPAQIKIDSRTIEDKLPVSITSITAHEYIPKAEREFSCKCRNILFLRREWQFSCKCHSILFQGMTEQNIDEMDFSLHERRHMHNARWQEWTKFF